MPITHFPHPHKASVCSLYLRISCGLKTVLFSYFILPLAESHYHIFQCILLFSTQQMTIFQKIKCEVFLFLCFLFFIRIKGGTKAAYSIKCPILDLISGHDLMVHVIESHHRLCADSTEPAKDSLSPSLCPPLAL